MINNFQNNKILAYYFNTTNKIYKDNLLIHKNMLKYNNHCNSLSINITFLNNITHKEILQILEFDHTYQ